MFFSILPSNSETYTTVEDGGIKDVNHPKHLVGRDVCYCGGGSEQFLSTKKMRSFLVESIPKSV